jgi:septal ring factor EnvC (AmiA/AmiB activator)
MLSKLKLMLASASTWIALLCFIGFLSVAYLYKKQVEENTLQQTQIIALQTNLNNLYERIAEEQKRHTELQNEKQKVQQEFNKTKTELDKFKGRESVVAARPTLVQRQIQRSFDEFVKSINCATGDKSRCE